MNRHKGMWASSHSGNAAGRYKSTESLLFGSGAGSNITAFAIGLLVVFLAEYLYAINEKLLHAAANGRELHLEIAPVALLAGLCCAMVNHFAGRAAWRTKQQIEAEAAEAADIDGLTQLDSRFLVEKQLANSLGDGMHVLALFNPKRFNNVNCSFGFEVGDDVLREIGQRLRLAFPGALAVGRLHTDVFAVVSKGVDDRVEIENLLESVRILLEQPFYEKLGISLEFAIGVTVFHGPARTANEVVREADIALHAASLPRDSCIRYYTDEMMNTIKRRGTVEIRLRQALKNNEVTPYFQPIINLETRELLGFEVLARWTDGELGHVSPVEFISVAETTGLIGRLGEQLLRVACRQATNWPGKIRLSVNLSPLQLSDPTAGLRILAILGETGFSAARLQLEITETAELDELPSVKANLQAFRRAGIRVVIDDFGTGYCSFERLVSNQIDGLKIDKSFVLKMVENDEMAALVQASIQIAQQLGLTVTAEGVENESIHLALLRMGCNLGQGYHYGRPMPLADAHRLVIEKVSRQTLALTGHDVLAAQTPIFA